LATFPRTHPAVTLGFSPRAAFEAGSVSYVASGVLVLCGQCWLRFLFPQSATLGATVPAGSAMRSFVLEMLLTALLMFVILSVSTGAREKGITAGIAVGAVIALEALFAGPICGASMNPARSLAPGLVSGHLSGLWIYLVAPVLGAALGVIGCSCVRERGCCSGAEADISPA
jgi:aquaporin Z